MTYQLDKLKLELVANNTFLLGVRLGLCGLTCKAEKKMGTVKQRSQDLGFLQSSFLNLEEQFVIK